MSSLAAKWLIVKKPLAKADAIVVLSGAATFRERTQFAAALYREGRAPTIILTNDNLKSSWSTQEQRNPFYYERASAELERLGVPENAIQVIRTPVNGTSDEAELLKNYCVNQKLKSLLIVTSAFHSRRAERIFSDVFKDTQTQLGIEPVPTGNQTPSAAVWWLYPRGWLMVPTEYAKLIYYSIRNL
ncbi:MAG TPA: YdcF family protein [Pyrinomonadaceae bacterium]|nr:YdcF family protein [Pyrinomonadaceae bacterium]